MQAKKRAAQVNMMQRSTDEMGKFDKECFGLFDGLKFVKNELKYLNNSLLLLQSQTL